MCWRQRGLAGAWRCDDESALTLPNRAHQVDHSRRVTIGHGLEPDQLVRADHGQLVEDREVERLLGFVAVDFCDLEKLRTAVAASRQTFHPLAVAQIEGAAQFGSDKDVVGMLGKGALGIAEKTEAFAGNFHDALGVADFILARRLFRLRRFDRHRFKLWFLALARTMAPGTASVRRRRLPLRHFTAQVWLRRVARDPGARPLRAETAERELGPRSMLPIRRRACSSIWLGHSERGM